MATLLGFLAGLIIGSFIATVAIRWPEGRSAMRGRSECDACGRTLGPVDLIPLLGFLIRRGKCASCGASIEKAHPLIELAAGLIGALALWAAPGWEGLAGAGFGWMLLALAVLDIGHLWLPDRLTIPLGLVGLALGFTSLPPSLIDRLIGAAAGFLSLALIALLYRIVRKREGLGGGDPKLFGAIGAWLGWAMLPYVLLLASVAGLASVGLAVARGNPVSATARLPFGALLAVAAFPVWLISAA